MNTRCNLCGNSSNNTLEHYCANCLVHLRNRDGMTWLEWFQAATAFGAVCRPGHADRWLAEWFAGVDPTEMNVI